MYNKSVIHSMGSRIQESNSLGSTPSPFNEFKKSGIQFIGFILPVHSLGLEFRSQIHWVHLTSSFNGIKKSGINSLGSSY
ncbi:hypothetical protein CEXT_484081 [Caerostris extrusa]|uniref:Uncharacterized protein n=1 Tax=Caerostris extrusa TaxID=172846 RepID=A0AAV4S9T1_CAEEX|nr:hypothetical protein CEXT_484081 [Caerostris extrusa]